MNELLGEWWLPALVLTLSHLTCVGIGSLIGRSAVSRKSNDRLNSTAEAEDKHRSSISREEFEARVAVMESRVSALEVENKWLCEQRTASPRAADNRDSLEMANKLAKSGTSVEELMNICDLGRGEAELIHVLNSSGGAQIRSAVESQLGSEPKVSTQGDSIL